jgi:hypothetical protein
VPALIRAMALHRTGAAAEARRSLATAALSFDWNPAAAVSADSWMLHVLRREAEALIRPELADLLAGRGEPADDETRAAMAAALVAASRDAEAARLYEEIFREPSDDTDRNQRYLAARTVVRAGAPLGGQVEAPERADFRGLVRAWVRADLAECNAFLATDTEERRANVRKALNPWLDDPAFAAVRDAEAMEPLSAAERDEWRALWLEVEALIERLEPTD